MLKKRGSLVSRLGLMAIVGMASAQERLPTTVAYDPLDGWRYATTAVSVDPSLRYDGKASIRIERDSRSRDEFSTISRSMPIDFAGSKIELRGHLRTKDVSSLAGFWMREDGVDPAVEFDNMASRRLSGTTGWAEYAITLPISPRATKLSYGVLLAGTGVVWSDQPRLFVDGTPIADVHHVERRKTVFDTDREFDGGSRIKIDALSDRQLDSLVLTGEVWGFLKYFHPALTAGTRQWDYELLRWLPRLLAAPTREETSRLLAEWIETLGPLAPCSPCAEEASGPAVQSASPTGWIRDEARLGHRLSSRLVDIYRNRTPGTQFYVSLMQEAGNPVFQNEPLYSQLELPDAGFQILAAYRFWAIVQYWFPYRELIAGRWEDALREHLAAVALARDGGDFDRAMLKLIARIADTHANLWSSLDARPPQGKCALPATVRFVESLPVVTDISPGHASGLRRGDIIRRLGGTPVDHLLADWLPYFAASNDAARLRDVGRALTLGPCADADLDVERAGKSLHVVERRTPVRDIEPMVPHDLPGPTFRLLSPDVAYLKLSSVKSADVAGYIEAAQGTKGLIVDIRNYPSESVVFPLGSRLIDTATLFALFTRPALSDPGVFRWSEPYRLTPSTPRYAGKVVILVDEQTQSHAEFTTMALRASPHAVVVGSTTAGADGNVSPIPLPGRRRAMISGIGVFYPDKRPTQQIGIVPDIAAKPTIRGIREGRDEVIERALREILGNAPSAEALRKLYR